MTKLPFWPNNLKIDSTLGVLHLFYKIWELIYYKISSSHRGVLRTPTTAPLRITDGRVGQARTEGTRGGIYQLIGDEAQAAP